MGLDIRALKNIKIVEDPKVSEADDLLHAYEGQFKDQFGSLVDDAYYDCEDEEWFCRIGYSGFGHFRNELAKLGGWNEKITEKPDFSDPDYSNKDYFHRYPYVADIYGRGGDTIEGNFVEVICFSDCEGLIDTDNCKKLLADFESHLDKAKELWADNERYLEFYTGLMNAFRFGSENGLVEFT